MVSAAEDATSSLPSRIPSILDATATSVIIQKWGLRPRRKLPMNDAPAPQGSEGVRSETDSRIYFKTDIFSVRIPDLVSRR